MDLRHVAVLLDKGREAAQSAGDRSLAHTLGEVAEFAFRMHEHSWREYDPADEDDTWDITRLYPDLVGRIFGLDGDPAPASLTLNPQGAVDAAMHSVWLHGNWRFLTQKMTTEEREAAADAVDRYCAARDAADPEDALGPADPAHLRWWR